MRPPSCCSAHPPLQSKDAAADAQKRPRGAGDILGIVDRAFWMHDRQEKRTETSYTLTAILEPTFAGREGGDLDPVVISVDGMENKSITVTADWCGSVAGVAQIGKVHACMLEIVKVLGLQTDREMYQPDLIEVCRFQDYQKDTYQEAIRHLLAQRTIAPPQVKPGIRKSGKWVRLIEEIEE